MSSSCNITPIEVIQAKDLTSAEFISTYVDANRPIIVQGALTEWRPSASSATITEGSNSSSTHPTAEWTISALQSIIGDRVMQNVFISSAHHRRRFKYFKSTTGSTSAEGITDGSATSSASAKVTPSTAVVASSPSSSSTSGTDQKAEAGLTRSSMTFNEFVERSKKENAMSEDQPAYYLYGEPLPSSLHSSFPPLPLLSSVLSSPEIDLTSTLLWVSPAPTCSPLHYDLSEGILAQVHGSKRVTLIDPKYHTEVYPEPVQHAHDRQSCIDDIHSPSADRFPLAVSLPRQSGVVEPGSFLYIPYGWWHQLESIDTSISISQRWNPHTEELQRLAIAWNVTKKMPVQIREQICAGQLAALPQVVAMVNRRRWDEI